MARDRGLARSGRGGGRLRLAGGAKAPQFTVAGLARNAIRRGGAGATGAAAERLSLGPARASPN